MSENAAVRAGRLLVGQRMLAWVVRLLQKFGDRREGTVAIQLGLMLPVLLGMAALAIEIGSVIYQQRKMQSVADAAVLGAQAALLKGQDFALEAYANAAAAGFANGANGVTISVNHPPLSGPHVTDPSAIEVIIRQPQTLTLASLFGEGAFSLSARAVASHSSPGDFCVLALNVEVSGALQLAVNAVLLSVLCGAGVNSASDQGLILAANAVIDGPVSVVGNWSLGLSAVLSLLAGPFPKNHAAPISDPFAGYNLNAPGGGCVNAPAAFALIAHVSNPSGVAHLCGLNYTNNLLVTIDPGIYYIDNQLTLSNNVLVNAIGVTLIVNGNYAISVGGNATLNFVAPASGSTAGLAIAGTNTGAGVAGPQKFSNNTLINLEGAIYFPKQTVEFDNNGSIVAPLCGLLIADQIKLGGLVNLGDSLCIGKITSGSASMLVE